MSKFRQRWSGLICGCLSFWLAASGVHAADSFVWNKQKNQVTADVRGLNVTNLLERVAVDTGWEVFLEPGISHKSSVKFKELSAGEALRMLLGDVNFALIPQTNAGSRLYVFRTAINNATQRIGPGRLKAAGSKSIRVSNELIVRLKPGESIDELARGLGAKVVGYIPELNAYRLKFDDAAATNVALAELASNPDVASVDFNYYMDRPETPQGVISSTALPPQLKIKPGSDSSGLVVGIIDTAVQSLGGDLDKFVIKRFSVDGDATAASGSDPTHGTTMVESILRGLESTGIDNTSVRFKVYNAFGGSGATTTWDVASGMVTLVNDGISWLNVSLGSDADSGFLRDIVQSVSDRGIAIFAAAGNEPTGEPVYPAAYPGSVAVTATTRGQIAPYANMAAFVDVAAPGSGIVYYQDRPYFVQGTSVSTAFTTGAAVGLAEKNKATWAQIQSTLFKALAVPSPATK